MSAASTAAVRSRDDDLDLRVVTPAFGFHAPTAVQARLISWFHGTVLGRSRLRRMAVERFKAERHGPVDATLFGLRARFHPHDNQTDAKGAVCGPSYNRDELRWLRRLLPVGGTFVDVGANMGFFTLAALSLGAKIVAIEPMPALFRRLSVNLALNGLEGRLFEEGAGERAGWQDLAFRNRDLGGSSMLATGASVRVAVRPLLDQMDAAAVATVDVLKIDVEGFEDRVLCPFLRDAPRRLLPRALIMEHCSEGDWEGDLRGLMASAGYREIARNRSNLLAVMVP